MNYLGNGLSVYLITHGNGGLFFIPFKMNAIILNREFGVRTVLRKYNSLHLSILFTTIFL